MCLLTSRSYADRPRPSQIFLLLDPLPEQPRAYRTRIEHSEAFVTRDSVSEQKCGTGQARDKNSHEDEIRIDHGLISSESGYHLRQGLEPPQPLPCSGLAPAPPPHNPGATSRPSDQFTITPVTEFAALSG